MLSKIIADAVYALLDAVDGESIVEGFRIGLHNEKHDFENHVKVAVREGLDPSVLSVTVPSNPPTASG